MLLLCFCYCLRLREKEFAKWSVKGKWCLRGYTAARTSKAASQQVLLVVLLLLLLVLMLLLELQQHTQTHPHTIWTRTLLTLEAPPSKFSNSKKKMHVTGRVWVRQQTRCPLTNQKGLASTGNQGRNEGVGGGGKK